MLNGVDLPARQALAERIREDSWEAQLSIGVQAHPEAGGRCRVDTEPMRMGSVRVARSFSLRQGDGGAAGAGSGDCLDPVGSVLVALGASVADSVVTRLSGEGCHLTLLEVLPAADFAPAPGGRAARLSYGLRIEGDVSAGQVREAVRAARERCSGHRTLEEPNELRVVVQTEKDVHLAALPRPADRDPAAPADSGGRRTARVSWEVGAHVIAEVDGVRADSDQPKQLFGADLAPSAQEYFLAALAAEALRFATSTPAPTPSPPPAGQDAVHASARIDLRGPYSSQDAPAGLRNVLVQLLPADPTAGDDGGDGGPAGAMRAWFAEGDALRLVRDAHPIHVDVVLNGTPLTIEEDTEEHHHAP
ncbi:OsmC family protein [Streptomyces roseolus]